MINNAGARSIDAPQAATVPWLAATQQTGSPGTHRPIEEALARAEVTVRETACAFYKCTECAQQRIRNIIATRAQTHRHMVSRGGHPKLAHADNLLSGHRL